MTQPTTDKARARLAAFLGYEPNEHDALFESHLDAHRAAVLREAADEAEKLRQFEKTTGARAAAQISENVGILRVADHFRRMADEETSR